MQPLRYSINVTLDGCVDHTAMLPDEELHRRAADMLAAADALIFGRVTYDLMEAGWREAAQSGVKPDWMADWMMPFARVIDRAKKYVVSDTLERVDWNAELVRGSELEATVRRLKQQPGRGVLAGGVTMPLALVELGLIDEYEFVVHPRLAGHGPTLFAGLTKPVDLKLVSRLEYGSGAVALRYEPRRGRMNNANHRIYRISLASVYPMYVAKVEKKGRSKAEVDEIIRWLTGHSQESLERELADRTSFEDFFARAPRLNPSRSLIKGVVCGVRVEDIEEPLMRELRYLDKLIDELARGKAMEKILRTQPAATAVPG